jgi:hypothetical protein
MGIVLHPFLSCWSFSDSALAKNNSYPKFKRAKSQNCYHSYTQPLKRHLDEEKKQKVRFEEIMLFFLVDPGRYQHFVETYVLFPSSTLLVRKKI